MVFIDLLSSPEGLVLRFDKVVMLKTPDVSPWFAKENNTKRVKSQVRANPRNPVSCYKKERAKPAVEFPK